MKGGLGEVLEVLRHFVIFSLEVHLIGINDLTNRNKLLGIN